MNATDQIARNNNRRDANIEIAGQQYVSASRLADMLGITARTLSRWSSKGIGPPKIKVGRLILFEVAKLPEWLASRSPVLESDHNS